MDIKKCHFRIYGNQAGLRKGILYCTAKKKAKSGMYYKDADKEYEFIDYKTFVRWLREFFLDELVIQDVFDSKDLARARGCCYDHFDFVCHYSRQRVTPTAKMFKKEHFQNTLQTQTPYIEILVSENAVINCSYKKDEKCPFESILDVKKNGNRRTNNAVSTRSNIADVKEFHFELTKQKV